MSAWNTDNEEYRRRLFQGLVCVTEVGGGAEFTRYRDGVRVVKNGRTLTYRMYEDGSTHVCLEGRELTIRSSFPRERWDGANEHLDLLPSVAFFLDHTDVLRNH